MKNPLNKRFARELKSDAGKYIAVFLFLVLFIGVISGFLVADNSVSAAYREGFDKYNIEDGHITFKTEPPAEILSQIEKAGELEFYNLFYKNEALVGFDADTVKTVRVYSLRDTVNTVCLMEGKMPGRADEIAIDRLFAETNKVNIGDTLRFSECEYKVSGYVALPDYSCLYENNSDMMFSAVNFCVAIVTPEGFDNLGDSHLFFNYAWKYLKPYADETEQNDRSEALIKSLENIIKKYDEKLIQAQVDKVWSDAVSLSEELENKFREAADEIENKVKKAGEDAVKDALATFSQDEISEMLLKESDMTEEQVYSAMMEKANLTSAQKMKLAADSRTLSEDELLEEAMEMTGLTQDDIAAMLLEITGITEERAGEILLGEYCEKNNTTARALVAAKLGTTEKAIKDMQTAFEDAENLTGDLDINSKEAPKIDFDKLEKDSDIESGLDFSFDDIYSIIGKVDATGIYDTAEIRKTLGRLEKLMDIHPDDSDLIEIKDYIPRYQNMAIMFTGNDMNSDHATVVLMLYIMLVILAFVFAVTISNTISKEAGSIGTLRASGYSGGELIRHYLVLPVTVTALGAVAGNILGYTVFESLFVKIYYTSYSLVTYKTLMNGEAFLLTTVSSVALMLIVNIFVLARKMKVRPLDFLRGEVSSRKRKKAVKISPKLPFLQRFGLRIFFQNAGSYAVLFFGILFGGILAVFGMLFGPMFEEYSVLARETMFCDYQYIVKKDSVETDNAQAEKFCMTALDSDVKGYVKDSVSIYGIADNSSYIKADIPAGEVLVSEGIMKKFRFEPGDKLTLKEPYSTKTYSFTIAGDYPYLASLAVFMPRDDYLEMFDKSGDYFTGYFSNSELTDIDEDDIYTTIRLQDATKIVDQLSSLIGFMDIFMYFGVVIFLLLMFLLTKQIIEKNSRSIAMTKILGFKNGEIAKLYLLATSAAVVISLLLSVPVIHLLLQWAFRYYLYVKMSGYIPYIVSNTCYIKLFVMGIASYAVVAALMLLKIRKVPMGEALKNQNM
ncbi:MAG: hypothetical protein K6F64_08220 [Clostridia bacterium]|nr:hypothetical protein [Clostridia bacterium]